MTPRRPALIFDFGNVIGFFDYRRAAAALGARLGVPPDDLWRRTTEAGFTPLLQRFESGRISPEAFSAEFAALAGLNLSHDDFVPAWSDIFWPNEPVAAIAAALKQQGHTLVLGSNTNALHAAHFRNQFREVLAHFDGLVLSYEVGHLKPSPAFYLACATAARAPAADCVFIDDLPENVEGARSAGLQALLYRDPVALRHDLATLGARL